MNLVKLLLPSLQNVWSLHSRKGYQLGYQHCLYIDSHGCALHKLAFKDAVSLRYDWMLQNLPSSCSVAIHLVLIMLYLAQLENFPTLGIVK